MKNKKKELLERVLLLIKYDNSQTLSENKFFLVEQLTKPIDYSSVEKSQGINRTLNPNDYKTANDYCNRGSVKDLQWVNDNLNGSDIFQGKKGYCRLSDNKQKSLSQSLGNGAGGFWNIPIFPVKTQDEWYAVFAVWLAQMVEEWKYTNLYLNKSGYEGACEKNKLGVTYFGDISLQDLLSGKKQINTSQGKRIFKSLCYNEDLAVYKPYNQIVIKNITSGSGRLNRNSFKRYNGYIPSYAEVIKSYGFAGNVKNIITGLDTAKKNDFFIGATNIKKGDVTGVVSEPTTGSIHDVLSLLQIVSVIIPVAGPFISLGLGLVDSGIYYAEGEKEMAALTLGLSILFDLPILKAGFGSIGKGAISNLTDEEIIQMSKAILENDTKNLPKNLDETLKALEKEMKSNPSVRKEYEKVIQQKSKEILGNKPVVDGLSPNTKAALGKAAAGKMAGQTFVAGTVGAGLPLTAKGGYEVTKPLIRGNIKTQVEAEGLNWESVKKIFGSTGSAEDNQKLLDAWLLGWRPGLDVPEKYQTEIYKQNQKAELEKIAQELVKSFGLEEPEMMKSIEAKTLTPLIGSLSNPKIISTRDSLENTYDDYDKFLGPDE